MDLIGKNLIDQFPTENQRLIKQIHQSVKKNAKQEILEHFYRQS